MKTEAELSRHYKLDNAAMGIYHRRNFLRTCAGAGFGLGASRFVSGATDRIKIGCCAKLKELQAVIGPKPLSHVEIDKIKASRVRALPGSYETTGAVLGALATNQLYGRPDDYVQTLKAKIEAQTDAAVQAAATRIYRPDALTWVIVGDLQQIEKPVRALNLGTVQVLDADGKVVR